jgi:uncharacterized protein (DUF1501 family)
VRSFIHTDCTKRILTGGPSDLKPDFAAIAASETARELPVPYLVLGNAAMSGPLTAITGRTGTTNQIAALLSPAAAYPHPGSYLPSPGFLPTAEERDAVRRYLEGSAEQVRLARGERGLNAARVADFVSSLERAGRLQEFAQTGSGFGQRSYTPALSVQVPVAVSALSGGISRCIMMGTTGWDTHDDNARQGPMHESLFSGLIELATQLERAQLLDRTVVVAISEMGRTPKANATGGKDHWPVTSALLFGAGVRGGRSYGASDPSLNALSIDLTTGEARTGGTQLQTSHLAAGILSLVGVDPGPHFPDIEPFGAFLLT